MVVQTPLFVLQVRLERLRPVRRQCPDVFNALLAEIYCREVWELPPDSPLP